jgi:hypothetical protein
MSVPAELLSEIESAVNDSTKGRQADVLTRVTDLFAGRAGDYSEEQVAVFGSVMSHLISHVESRALAELSARLAPLSTAPAEVVRRLARDDDVEIAGPVLSASERLRDEDLTDIASRKSQAHLGKIAGRARLSEAVTDALVEHGEADVINEVAANQGASFSNSGMAKLVLRADGDGRLTVSLGKRSDISRRLFHQLLEQATESVRTKLLAEADPKQRDVLQQVLDDLAAQVGRKKSGDYARAKNVVGALGQDTALTRAKLLEFADGRQTAELIAALSMLSDLSIAQVERLFNAREGFGLMVLCKAIVLDWMTAQAVIAAHPGQQDLAGEMAAGLAEQYRNLSMSFSQKLLQSWRDRHSGA